MSLRSASPALAAALLFGASTPLAKLLAGNTAPLLLAGLLYLGSGVGLGALLLARHLGRQESEQPATSLRIPRAEVPWLLGAIVAGGMLGPAFLMFGLAKTDAASASLLLNVEGVLTAVIAWVVFKENADRQIILGMVAIVTGGVMLAWEPGGATLSPGALLIVAACLCWAVDNNLTRKVSTNDAMLVACLKGLIAGACNTAIAFVSGAALPSLSAVGFSVLVGFFGYGLSLSLFVIALRNLGTARTGAYFSVAPLIGVIVSLSLWPEPPRLLFWAAAALMGVGIWLHLRERHEHEHTHTPLDHNHRHRHDEHHQHKHDFAWDGAEPHAHAHQHAVLTHKHQHYPDIHHRHFIHTDLSAPATGWRRTASFADTKRSIPVVGNGDERPAHPWRAACRHIESACRSTTCMERGRYMNPKEHWESVYGRVAGVHQLVHPHLQRSLHYIKAAALSPDASIIDVGGGEPTLVDDLLAEDFDDVTVLDISTTALEVAKRRLDAQSGRVKWLAADVLSVALPAHAFDIWHDRAVFHFLTTNEERERYVDQVLHALRPGGFAIVGAFGPEGPNQCSGLPVKTRIASKSPAGGFGHSGRSARPIVLVPKNFQHITAPAPERCSFP